MSSSGARKRLRLLAQILLTALAGLVIAWKVPLVEVFRRLLSLHAESILLLVALTMLQVFVGVIRWWRLLHRLDERPSLGALCGDTAVGLLYNVFLPTSLGGDVVRALRAGSRLRAPHHAWSTSLFERLAGLLSMALAGTLAMIGAAYLRLHIPGLIVALALTLTIGLLVLFLASDAPIRLLQKSAGRFLPARAQRELDSVTADLRGPLSTRGARMETLLWSAVYQALGILFVVVGARSLGAFSHTLALCIGIPLVHILSMLPITLGGHGLREGLFVAVLGRLGVSSDIALALSLQWLASSVFFAAVGFVVSLAAPVGLSGENPTEKA